MVLGECDRCGRETRATVITAEPGGHSIVTRCEDCQKGGGEDGRGGG